MRFLIIVICCSMLPCCIKKAPKNPIPALEYKDFQAWKVGTRDTAVLTISYNDYDGDLFRNTTDDGPNTVIRTFIYNADSSKFIKDKTLSYTLIQPGDGFYKGKSISGDIILPMSEFRPNSSVKRLRFEIFMVDMANNKSNEVSTPQFTLTF